MYKTTDSTHRSSIIHQLITESKCIRAGNDATATVLQNNDESLAQIYFSHYWLIPTKHLKMKKTNSKRILQCFLQVTWKLY